MPKCGHCFCQQCLKSAFERVQLIKENCKCHLYSDLIDIGKNGILIIQPFFTNIENNVKLKNMMDPVSYFISDKGTLQCPEDEVELDPSITSDQSLRKNFNLI